MQVDKASGRHSDGPSSLPYPPPSFFSQHSEDEYGMQVDKASGGHSGGPFPIQCSPAMRVEDLRILIRVSLGLKG